MTIAFWAFFLDYAIGDPRTKWHPVVIIGNIIAGIEASFYHEKDSNNRKLCLGGLLVLIVLLISYNAAAGIINLVALGGNQYLVYIAQALLLSFTISPRSLAQAGQELFSYLQAGDLDQARYKVGWIVGRDTENLTSAEVTRATVETIAENTVDGVIAPLFFFAIGGVPLAALYRAANTMDSMLGYKNEKYLYFGRVAARVDDVLNYIPARITGFIFVLAALLLRYDFVNAFHMMLRDASKHPSPNGGWAEATLAGALHIRLGGLNYYFGRRHFREYMGDPIDELQPIHIIGAIRLMYTATILFLLLSYVIFAIFGI